MRRDGCNKGLDLDLAGDLLIGFLVGFIVIVLDLVTLDLCAFATFELVDDGAS